MTEFKKTARNWYKLGFSEAVRLCALAVKSKVKMGKGIMTDKEMKAMFRSISRRAPKVQ
jgi:hypothetical protein